MFKYWKEIWKKTNDKRKGKEIKIENINKGNIWKKYIYT